MSIGYLIKVNRINKSYTQKDLADRLGCTVPFVSQMELGQANVPAKMLKKLCKVLDIPKDKAIKYMVRAYAKELIAEVQ